MVIAVDPVALELGPIAVRWFGLMLALGLGCALLLTLREARRVGIGEDAVYAGALWSLLGAAVGARALHVLDRIDFYLQNPAGFGSLHGGMAVWGAILGGTAAAALYCRLSGLSAARFADVAVPGLLLGQIVGRIGSLIDGDAFAAQTSLPWAIVYTHPAAVTPDLGLATHPFALYEMIWNAAALGLVWRLRGWALRPGSLFLAYLALYAVGRLILDVVRLEAPVIFGLQQAQVIAVLVLLVLMPWLARRIRRSTVPGAD